jgi:hypothetical protein
LIGVDVSAPSAGREAETKAEVNRAFSDTTRPSGPTTVFALADKPGESDGFTHCIDLMIAPGPESLAHSVIRRGALDQALLEIRRADAEAAAGMDAGPRGRQCRDRPGTAGAMPLLERAKKVTLFASLDTQDADLIVAGAFWTFAALRKAVRRGDARSHASAIPAGGDVALSPSQPARCRSCARTSGLSQNIHDCHKT